MDTGNKSGPIAVGLVGFGLAGRAFHSAVISRVPGLRLAAIVQRTGDQAAQAYPETRIGSQLRRAVGRAGNSSGGHRFTKSHPL